MKWCRSLSTIELAYYESFDDKYEFVFENDMQVKSKTKRIYSHLQWESMEYSEKIL